MSFFSSAPMCFSTASPARWPCRVVHLLEVVDVDDDDGELRVVPDRERELRDDALLEMLQDL